MNLDDAYNKIIGWLLYNGPKIIFAIVVFIVGQWIIHLCKKWLRHNLHKREIDSSLRPFFHSLLVTVLQVFLLLTVMQILGIQMTVLAAAIASLGVAAGLALSGTLQNFTSGVLILILKPYKVGDIIVAQGQEGKVSEIQIFYTIVTTNDRKTVIIPNNKLSNEVITNLSREGCRRLDVELKFGYAFNIEQIRKTILDSIVAIEGIEKEPAPEVNILLVEPDGYKLRAAVWVEPEKFNTMKNTVNQTLIDGLRTAGIKLPGMV